MYIIYILTIIFFIVGFIIKKTNNNNENDIKNYLILKNPMTDTEKKFVSYLKPFTDKYNLIILPQVQLQSVFKIYHRLIK